MSSHIYRAITEPIRNNPSYDQRWNGPDKGLITCWEVGRRKREIEPEFVAKIENDELPILGWKGGVEKKSKKGEKYGTLFYLAQWQGIRGEDLDIDLENEVTLRCSKTGMYVTYTCDPDKYGLP